MSLSFRTTPSATAITTAERVLARTGLTIPDEYLALATSAIESHLDRGLAQAAVTETFSGSDRSRLYLARTPVVSIDEVREETTVIATTEYGLEEGGALWRSTPWRSRRPGVRNIELTPLDERGEEVWAVDYVGGYVLPSQDGTGNDPNYASPDAGETLLPVDLEFAGIDLAIHYYNRRTGVSDVASERLGDWAATYRSDSGDIPMAIEKRLEPYRRLW